MGREKRESYREDEKEGGRGSGKRVEEVGKGSKGIVGKAKRAGKSTGEWKGKGRSVCVREQGHANVSYVQHFRGQEGKAE